MQLLSTVPALPVRNIKKSTLFYRDILGLMLRHQDHGYAIFYRDAVEVHLWQADDEGWQTRTTREPVRSGVESFIAGTASCRIAVLGIDELYALLHPFGVIHPNGQIGTKPWRTREFGVADPDNNVITFFESLS